MIEKKISLILMLLIALFTTTSAYAQDEKKDPCISFDKENLEYTIGQEQPFVEPKLNNPNNVPVYFVSDNNSAATVDYNTGKVSFITQGIVKISAISNETDDFAPAQACYTITVNDNSIIFEASFINNDCGFKESEGPATAWEHESDGYMKADAYAKVDTKTAFCLVSPDITLHKVGNIVSFGESGSYFGNRWKDEAQLVIREAATGGDWEVLDRNYPSGDQNVVKSTGNIQIPSKYNGKTVNIAFRYISDGHKNSGVWHVRNLHIKADAGAKAEAELSFEKEKVEYVFGSDELFIEPKLINPNNLEVKYSSSDASVASVDESTGTVSIMAMGTAVITAESVETDAYKAGKASYTINVISVEDAQYAESALRSPVVAVEFTGQRCRYCPNQARGLEEKQIKYGKDNFIITALHHLESFSKLPDGQVSLYNEEAMQYAESLEIHEGLPQLAYNSLGPGRTDLTIDEMFQEDDLLECTGNVTYNNSNEYNINIKTRLRRNQKNALEGKQVDIILWTLENGIVAFQDDNGNYTYPEHNHIFRGSINTTWGEPYEVGTEYTNILKAPASVMEIKNTEIVVFFIDHESRMILDAGCFTATSDDTGIEDVTLEDAEADIYNLIGMKVKSTVKGQIYIKNGKKFIAQ